MKRLLLSALFVTTLSAIVALPAQAREDQWISRNDRLSLPTSNALPLLETDSIQGRITSIDGNHVQIALPNGEARTYRIGESRQQQYGLKVGSELVLRVRRLNNAVTSISEVNSIAEEQPMPDVSQQPSEATI